MVKVFDENEFKYTSQSGARLLEKAAKTVCAKKKKKVDSSDAARCKECKDVSTKCFKRRQWISASNCEEEEEEEHLHKRDELSKNTVSVTRHCQCNGTLYEKHPVWNMNLIDTCGIVIIKWCPLHTNICATIWECAWGEKKGESKCLAKCLKVYRVMCVRQCAQNERQWPESADSVCYFNVAFFIITQTHSNVCVCEFDLKGNEQQNEKVYTWTSMNARWRDVTWSHSRQHSPLTAVSEEDCSSSHQRCRCLCQFIGVSLTHNVPSDVQKVLLLHQSIARVFVSVVQINL